MQMLVNCSVFTLGAKVSIMEDSKVINSFSSTMDADSIEVLAKENKVDTIYVRGPKGFTSKLCADLIVNFAQSETKIIRID